MILGLGCGFDEGTESLKESLDVIEVVVQVEAGSSCSHSGFDAQLIVERSNTVPTASHHNRILVV